MFCLSPAPPRIHWSARLHCSSGSRVCILMLFERKQVITLADDCFFCLKVQSASGWNAADGSRCGYCNLLSWYRAECSICGAIFYTHHTITFVVLYNLTASLLSPATPFLLLSTPSSFSPYFISSSFLILPYRLLSCCLSDTAAHSTTDCLWCVHLPTAAGSHKHLPSQHCDVQHNHDTTRPNDHIQCHN